MSLAIGARLGRYEILGPLGAGGMGEVLKAKDTELERVVAVKVLPESVAEDPQRLERFQREARALAALSHPNLLDIYDVGSANGLHYAVTELLEGDTLRQKIPTSGLPWQKVAEMGAAVADGLAAAHGKGIVHRDLKPENLFVTTDGRVKILDFGLARLEEDFDPEGRTGTLTPAGTEAGTIMGTPGYMAPEQVKGQLADARSDIFALGCVLYEMISGHRAFGGDTGMEVMAAILKEEPPQLSSTGAKVPVDLERAVHRCLEKRPEARFQSAADLAYGLKHLGSSQAVPVMATSTPTAVTPVQEKRRPWWQLAVAGVLLLVAAVIAWQALSPKGEQPPAEPVIELNPNRIAVVPFTNRTADVTLDGLAARTADRLTQGLAELEELEVAPTSAVAAAAAGGAGTGALVREVAKATNSGLVLTGVWDSVLDGLELQATLQNAQTETIVNAFDPIPASLEAPDEAIATLRDWTLMAVQDHLYPALAFGAGDRFPKYEAYKEYRAWFEENLASNRWQKVLDLDPDFLRARLVTAFGAAMFPKYDLAEAILAPIEGDERLSVLQTHIVNALRDHLEGRWEDAFAELELVLERGQDNWLSRFMAMEYALRSNRPSRSLVHFEALGPPPLGMRLFSQYALNTATDACHLLARYDEELALAHQLQAVNPVWGAWRAARALVALGRLDEVEELVSAAQAARQGPGGAAGVLMHKISVFLKKHGYHEESVAMAERAAEWWRTSNLEEQGSQRCEYCAADSLASAGRFDEAMAIYRELERQDPSDTRALGSIAVTAAHQGDRITVEEMLARLSAIDDVDSPGDKLAFQASLAELLGDCDDALRLIQEAIASGYSDWIGLHGGSGCVSDNPEFQKLIQPRG